MVHQGAGGLNANLAIRIILGWAATLVVCGLTCALLFSQGAYAPYAYDTIENIDPSP